MTGSAPKQILAIGGGGFNASPNEPSLDRYLIEISGRENPKVCFVGTASADSPQYIIAFYACYSRLGCRPTHMPLFNPPTSDLRSYVLEQDVVYVGGGNTKNMLALWREWELDAIFREAWERGIVLAGSSAGANCWFEQSVTDSIPGPLTALGGLGFLAGSICPHFDAEPERRPSYHRLMTDGAIRGGYAVDNLAALHFIGDRLHRAVRSDRSARAYRVERSDGTPVEAAVETAYLG